MLFGRSRGNARNQRGHNANCGYKLPRARKCRTCSFLSFSSHPTSVSPYHFLTADQLFHDFVGVRIPFIRRVQIMDHSPAAGLATRSDEAFSFFTVANLPYQLNRLIQIFVLTIFRISCSQKTAMSAAKNKTEIAGSVKRVPFV